MFDDTLTVIDIGGSIVAPDGPDTAYLGHFLNFIRNWLEAESSRRIILVVGGGCTARSWQEAARTLAPHTSPDSLDWIGVMATRLNAELVRALFEPLCLDPVVTNPSADFIFSGRVLLAAGWKPGFSTDYDAVILAERFSVKRILMLSNIAQVYDSDPRCNPSAIPLSRLTWDEYMAILEEKWTPGANLPFDPVATHRAAEIGLSLVVADGHDLNNLEAILEGREFIGTQIRSAKE